ncbi:MAG: DNA N-6-adenine-methyltransferase [bacterium]|nr:DNA N-6-adenine-methyltransferase [bacterium]
MNDLTITEKAGLENLESIIESGLRTFVEVGAALSEIRESRLYRAEYDTFEAYCHNKWNIERRQAYRLITAAAVVENVSNWTQTPPTNESQARPLTSLPPEQQREAWADATKTAASNLRTVTAQDVTDAVQKIKPHVSYNSGENEWYTPDKYVEAARCVMGSIDIDPASSEIANQTVKANKFYTIDDSGLEKEWLGNVFLNPPYASDLIKQFSSKFVKEASLGNIKSGVVLVNNATETIWFRDFINCSGAVVFTQGRVRFLDPQGNPGAPLQGQAIIYYGHDVSRFLSEFSEFGWGALL